MIIIVIFNTIFFRLNIHHFNFRHACPLDLDKTFANFRLFGYEWLKNEWTYLWSSLNGILIIKALNRSDDTGINIGYALVFQCAKTIS